LGSSKEIAEAAKTARAHFLISISYATADYAKSSDPQTHIKIFGIGIRRGNNIVIATCGGCHVTLAQTVGAIVK